MLKANIGNKIVACRIYTKKKILYSYANKEITHIYIFQMFSLDITYDILQDTIQGTKF